MAVLPAELKSQLLTSAPKALFDKPLAHCTCHAPAPLPQPAHPGPAWPKSALETPFCLRTFALDTQALGSCTTGSPLCSGLGTGGITTEACSSLLLSEGLPCGPNTSPLSAWYWLMFTPFLVLGEKPARTIVPGDGALSIFSVGCPL